MIHWDRTNPNNIIVKHSTKVELNQTIHYLMVAVEDMFPGFIFYVDGLNVIIRKYLDLPTNSEE
jgi:hypothetical protein